MFSYSQSARISLTTRQVDIQLIISGDPHRHAHVKMHAHAHDDAVSRVKRFDQISVGPFRENLSLESSLALSP
jgi:hypothetical protein